MKYDVKDIKLAETGKLRIEWAAQSMPVLDRIRERFAKEKPLKGVRLAACLHVTTETANLMQTLKAGGADVALCASNPLSTQDDVAASLGQARRHPGLRHQGRGPRDLLRAHQRGPRHQPHVTMDDGADLVSILHSERQEPARRRASAGPRRRRPASSGCAAWPRTGCCSTPSSP